MKRAHSRPHIIILVLLIALILSGCSSIHNARSLRDAQQTFSTAAQLENRQRLAERTARDLQADLPVIDHIAISTAYAATIDSLNRLDVNELKKQGLLSNVYALKAISYWRLQKYSLALHYQKLALDLHHAARKVAASGASRTPSGTPENTLGDRDGLMMQILPALIQNDQARQQVLQLRGSTPAEQQLARHLHVFTGSMQTLDKHLSRLPADHALYTYLLVSRLGVFANYVDTCQLYAADSRRIPCLRQQVCHAKKRYDQLPRALQTRFRKLFLGNLGKQCRTP